MHRLWLVLIPALFWLSACAVGRDFLRPDTDASLKLGLTTPAEVIAQYGQPRGSQEMNSLDLDRLPIAMPHDQLRLAYLYGFGRLNARAAIFGFKDGRLATLLYISTFLDDQRPIDPPAVQALFAGQPPTRDVLVGALGPPQARILDPAGHPSEADAWYMLQRRNIEHRVDSVRIVPARMLVVRFSSDGHAVAHTFAVDDSP